MRDKRRIAGLAGASPRVQEVSGACAPVVCCGVESGQNGGVGFSKRPARAGKGEQHRARER
jgi:hypothetical protein